MGKTKIGICILANNSESQKTRNYRLLNNEQL